MVIFVSREFRSASLFQAIREWGRRESVGRENVQFSPGFFFLVRALNSAGPIISEPGAGLGMNRLC